MICQKLYPEWRNAKRHFVDVHMGHVKGESYTCPLCPDKTFFALNYLKRHLNRRHRMTNEEMRAALKLPGPSSSTSTHGGK